MGKYDGANAEERGYLDDTESRKREIAAQVEKQKNARERGEDGEWAGELASQSEAAVCFVCSFYLLGFFFGWGVGGGGEGGLGGEG